MKDQTMARYEIVNTPPGRQYRFYCDLSGALVSTTQPYQIDDPTAELETAWKAERKYFNYCPYCDAVLPEASVYCPDCGQQQPRSPDGVRMNGGGDG